MHASQIGTTGRRLAKPVALLAVALLLAMGVAPSPAAADTNLTVTTAAGGYVIGGTTTAMVVTVGSDSAVRGTLRFVSDGVELAAQEVEVPGGSAREIVVLVAMPPWFDRISVTFDAGGDASTSENVVLRQTDGDELVGVLGELASRPLPETADLTVDLGQARLFSVDSALLEMGPTALEAFSHIVATPGDLAELTPTATAAIGGWLAISGGRLLVDGEPVPLDELGLGDWSASGTASNDIASDGTAAETKVGTGSLAFTNGEAGRGNFDGLVRPMASAQDSQYFQGWGGMPVTQTMAADAGVKIPDIGGLALGLVGYLILVGPVMWIVLRRTGREPLLWLALPAAAVVASLGVWAVGRQLRDASTEAHATIVADFGAGTYRSTQVLVTSANGGKAGINLPDGWTAQQDWSDYGNGDRRMQARPIQRDNEVEVDLPPGGISLVGAQGFSAVSDPAFDVQVSMQNDEIVGKVTNLTGYRLTNLTVAVSQDFQNIAALDPGETAEVSFNANKGFQLGNDRLLDSLGQRAWEVDADGNSNPSVIMNWFTSRPDVRRADTVIVFGWTKESDAPVSTLAGDTVDSGRTVFISARPLSGDVRSTAELIRGFGTTTVTDPAGDGCAEEAFGFALTPASSTDPSRAVLGFDQRAVAAADIWDGSTWVPSGIGQADPGADSLALTPSSIIEGTVYLRMRMDCQFWEVSSPIPVVRPATAGDILVTS